MFDFNHHGTAVRIRFSRHWAWGASIANGRFADSIYFAGFIRIEMEPETAVSENNFCDVSACI